MLTKAFLVLFILSSFLVSCKQKENVEGNINSYTNAVLAASQETTKLGIRKIMDDIREKTRKLELMDTAFVYQSKADKAIELGNNMLDYIDSLIEITKNLEKWDKKDDGLFERLKMYERNLEKIDAGFNQHMERTGEGTILNIDTINRFKNMDSDQFNNLFLKDCTKNDYISFLNSLKENILIIETEMVSYFNLNCGYVDNFYEKYSIVVSQNLERLKPNSTLEITAGIGEFNLRPHTKFIIGNKEIPISDSIEGVTVYKMKVSKELGKHTIPVKISWMKPNGETVWLEKKLFYYVE